MTNKTVNSANGIAQTDADLAETLANSVTSDPERLLPVQDSSERDLVVSPANMSADIDRQELPPDLWLSTQADRAAKLLDEALVPVKQFLKNNADLLTLIGLSILALLAIQVFFAGLNAIDRLPLVTPILKTIGAIAGAKFIWRYLIRQQDRQELFEILKRTKAEILGN